MNIVIIGGGASGMMAAIAAKIKNTDASVTVLERNELLGRKLLATGNGRCNFTNALALSTDYGDSAAFTIPAMTKMEPRKVMEFFDSLGVFARVEDEGRVYPYSGQGAAVTEAMAQAMERLNVDVRFGAVVKSVEAKVSRSAKAAQSKSGAAQQFIIALEGGQRLTADRVIVATGGRAGGQFGCQGDGYKMAQSLGHTLVKVRPALVAVNCKGWQKDWKGVRAQAKVTLLKQMVKEEGAQPQWAAEDRGEVQFTDSGLSGICVFNLSRYISYTGNMKEGRNEAYYLSVDFLPDRTEEQVLELLMRRVRSLDGQDADGLLASIVHGRLIPGMLKQAGLQPLTIVYDGQTDLVWPDRDTVTPEQLKLLAHLLKDWRFEVEGTKGWNDAQVTAGGIACDEVDGATMESRLCRGLYLCGEVLDVDGKCGGYNLQWAFASGYVAGESAVE